MRLSFVVEQVRQERYDMGRLPTLTRDVLAQEGQEVWDRIAAVRDGVRGPYEVLIRVPALADRVRALEAYFRSGHCCGALGRIAGAGAEVRKRARRGYQTPVA
jgi:hypothetical protein